jgi:hypothetical protein
MDVILLFCAISARFTDFRGQGGETMFLKTNVGVVSGPVKVRSARNKTSYSNFEIM